LGELEIKLKKNAIILILAFAFVLTIVSTSAAAINGTGNTNNTSIDLTSDCTGSDPIINGTVTVNEYGHVRPLEGATVIVNSTTGRVLASTTTDANGYYFMNFYSTDTTFNVIASYMGCTPISRSVTVNNGPNYPTDPNKYATQNFQLTPKTATLRSTGNGQSVYIQGQNKDGFAGVINVRVDGVNYVAYCIDLFTPISIDDTLLVNGPLPGTAGDLPSEVEWDKVSYILNNYNPSSDNEAAAIQCAIWYFTSVHYGKYNSSAPVGTYYQYMTAPRDGVIRGWRDDTTVRDRAWNIINQVNAASIPHYPNSVTVTPETTTVANGQPVTITATVRDINGNPLSGVTVNFQRTSGSLSRTSGTTDANGRVSTVLTLGNDSNSVVTAYVSGNYGNLLYDDQYASVRKQNMVARNVLPLTVSAFSIINTAATANVELTQTANNPVNVGDTVTYTVTATNKGPSTATGILISDIIPAGLSGVTVTPSVGTYYNGIWTIPTLNNGASATLTITGTATTAMAGLTTANTATRTSQEQYNNLPTTTTAGVYTKIADVTVNQTVNGGSSATVNVNDTVTYIITAVNNGVDAATNLQITDLIPSGLTDLSYTITGTGTYNPSTGLWNIGILNSGATTILTITGKVTAAMAGLTTTNYANRTSQTEYNPSAASTSTAVYTKLSDPIITQTVNGQSSGTVNVNVGDDVTFVVNAYCSGPDDATNIQIRDIVPAGLTGVTVTPSVGTYDSNTGIWTIPFLEKFTSATLTITGKAGTSMAGTSITNRATEIFQTEYNPAPGDSTSIPVYTKMADVTLSQTGNYQGNVVNFVVTATNNGPDTATNIKITDLIPSGLTGVTITPSIGTYDSNTGVWTIPELLDGASATLTITGTATPQTTVTNTAEKTSQTEYDPNTPEITTKSFYIPGVNIAVYNTPWYYLDIDQNYKYKYVVGNSPVFMLTAVNSLTRDEATGVILEYIIPNGFEYIGCNIGNIGTFEYTYDSINDRGIITWYVGYMPKGGSVTAYITLLVTDVGNRTPNLTTIANLKSVDQTDVNRNNDQNINCAIESPPSADIQVTQTYTQEGSQVTYTITVKNNGPSNATGVQITDILPSGVKWISDNSEGTYNPNTTGNEAGIWKIGTINSGTTKTLIINAQITGTGTIINTARKTALIESDSNYNNDAQTTYMTISGIYSKNVNIAVYNTPWYYLQSGDYKYKYVVGNSPVFMLTAVNSLTRDEATGVILEYIIPNGFEYIGCNIGNIGTFEYTYDSINDRGIITWYVGYMPKGGSVTAYITLLVTDVGNRTPNLTTIANLKSVDQTDVNRNNDQNINCAIESPPSADIQVTQTYTQEGSQVTYTITVKNNGPSNATGVQITDILPSGVKWISDNSEGTYNPNTTGNEAGIWKIGTINSGTTKTLIINAQITGTGTIINTARKTALIESDSNYNNDAQTTYMTRSTI